LENELSVVESARKLGVGLDRAYDLIWAGKLAARKVEGRWAVSREAVEERLRRRAQEAELVSV
jgi:excisionase family DNA binding protein